MEYEELDGPEGAPVRVPSDDGYRTCAECGQDCQPEPTEVEGLGIRIAFICAEHGVHSVVDPFEGQR